MAKILDNRDGYGGVGDAVRKYKICGTMEMKKWVGITATELSNINREQLPA